MSTRRTLPRTLPAIRPFMISEDVALVGSVMEDNGMWSHKREAWYRIKTELVEAQKTIHQHAQPAIALLRKFIDVFDSCGISLELAELCDEIREFVEQQRAGAQ